MRELGIDKTEAKRMMLEDYLTFRGTNWRELPERVHVKYSLDWSIHSRGLERAESGVREGDFSRMLTFIKRDLDFYRRLKEGFRRDERIQVIMTGLIDKAETALERLE